MKKRLLSTLLCLCMVAGMLPAAQADYDGDVNIAAASEADEGAVSGTCGEGLHWKLADGVLTVYGTGAMEDYYEFSKPWGTYTDSLDYLDPITKVVIEDGVTRVGDAAFAGCKNLVSVEIPASVTYIGPGAFGYETFFVDGSVAVGWACVSLKNISVDPNNPAYASRDNVLFSKDGKDLVQYPLGNEQVSYDIPEGVEKIGKTAFASSSLTSLTLPKSIRVIERDAFLYCDRLKDIYYAGSESDWNAIEITYSEFEKDDALRLASIHFDYDTPNVPDTPDEREVSITKTDIRADGVFNTEGCGSLIINGDFYIDDSGYEHVITPAQIALIDREGAFLFPYRDDPVGDGGYDVARFWYSDGIVSLTLGSANTLGVTPQYYHLDGSSLFTLEGTEEKYTDEDGEVHHEWTRWHGGTPMRDGYAVLLWGKTSAVGFGVSDEYKAIIIDKNGTITCEIPMEYVG